MTCLNCKKDIHHEWQAEDKKCVCMQEHQKICMAKGGNTQTNFMNEDTKGHQPGCNRLRHANTQCLVVHNGGHCNWNDCTCQPKQEKCCEKSIAGKQCSECCKAYKYSEFGCKCTCHEKPEEKLLGLYQDRKLFKESPPLKREQYQGLPEDKCACTEDIFCEKCFPAEKEGWSEIFDERFFNPDKFSAKRLHPNYDNGKGDLFGDIKEFIHSEISKAKQESREEIIEKAKKQIDDIDTRYYKKSNIVGNNGADDFRKSVIYILNSLKP